MNIHTTLDEIRECNPSPCTTSWRDLLEALAEAKGSKLTAEDHTQPISVLRILDILGLEDALWALRWVPPLHPAYNRLVQTVQWQAVQEAHNKAVGEVHRKYAGTGFIDYEQALTAERKRWREEAIPIMRKILEELAEDA